jgi:hypothetical protein
VTATLTETNIKLASSRQLHAAIVHAGENSIECAITLAAAAEGMLPATDGEHFQKKLKEFAAGLPADAEGATGPNDVITWLKHGTYKGKPCDTATIEEMEVLVTIWRAISKFGAVYDGISPEMNSWITATKEKLLNKSGAQRNSVSK